MNIRNTIFENESPEMILAFEKAQENFKYFGVNFIGNIEE